MDIYKLWFIILDIPSKVKISIINIEKDYFLIYKNRENIFKNTKYLKKILAINLNSDKIKKLEEQLYKKEYFVVIYDEIDYPEQLKQIEEPPFVLFYKGQIKYLNSKNFIAVVGSRKHSKYGEDTTRRIVSEISGQDNMGIVSGGAKGIDSIAHKVAVDNNLFNVAILGCGIDIIYPKVNAKLFNEISKNGVVLTEFLPGTAPMFYNFPRRNRLISALSKCVIVIEASEKSGATNTAYHACMQNKNVYAVPGCINSEFSKGCNALINDGALIYMDTFSVFKELGLYYKPNLKKTNYNIKLEILEILDDEPMHLNEIMKKIKVDRNIINELLFEMQFNNEVVGLTGNNYMKKILRNN
ncbi:MAG: DNA-processing protein DprA [Sarcina sp.]